MASNSEPGRWRLDKSVPLALVLAVFLQTIAFVWWAATLSNRVDQLEIGARVASEQPGKVIRLETQMENLTTTVDRIELKLDRVLRVTPP